MKKQDLRYRGSRRIVAGVLMLAVSVGTIVGAAVWYDTAKEDYMTAKEGVTVPVSVARVMDVTEAEKTDYHVESAAFMESDGALTGYTVITSQRGYKSDIRVQTTFAADGKTIAGIEVLSQDETEYLGNRVQTPEFTSVFAGRRAPMKLWGTVTPGSPMDALTGATISSQAVIDAVNHAYAFLKTRM